MTASTVSDIGYGLSGSVMYDLNFDYLYNKVFLVDDTEKAFTDIMAAYIVAFWNAYSICSVILQQHAY